MAERMTRESRLPCRFQCMNATLQCTARVGDVLADKTAIMMQPLRKPRQLLQPSFGWAAAAKECLRPDVTGKQAMVVILVMRVRFQERGTFHSSMCPAMELSAGAQTGLLVRRTLHIEFAYRH